MTTNGHQTSINVCNVCIDVLLNFKSLAEHQTLYFELRHRLSGRHTEIHLAGWSGRTGAEAKRCLNCHVVLKYCFEVTLNTIVAFCLNII